MTTNEIRGVDFISHVFSPRVAILSTPAADQLAHKNNLSLVQLLRPFAQMRTEASLRDPYNNTVHEVRNLKLKFESVSSEVIPDPVAVSQLLSAVVSDSLTKLNDGSKTTTKYGNYSLSMHPTAPWFESFRNHFMRTLPISQHEFTRHFVACLLVVSSSEPDIKTQFAMLEKRHMEDISESGGQYWFMDKVLSCRVLIHDVAEGDEKAAMEIMQELKNEIGRGPHLSYLLSINSRRAFEVQELLKNNRKYGPKMVDPWKKFLYENVEVKRTKQKGKRSTNTSFYGNEDSNGDLKSPNGIVIQPSAEDTMKHPLQNLGSNGVVEESTESSVFAVDDSNLHGLYLTSADQDTIRTFVDEFIRRALLPHYEKQIRVLYDQLVAKKAITKSFLSATKKWLSSGRSTQYPLHFGSAESANYYPHDASEVQLRKLGDLAFLFQMYDIAYSIYYQCKGDFSSDGAHLFHAGSLEMTVLSQFMLGKTLSINYIDNAISSYLYQCSNYDFALRCCLLCSELLLCKSLFFEATNNFLKLTSEHFDLKSALLLEQAAFCYINSRGLPKPRKFAFHMILSGYRYNKADQKHHSLRASDLALQVFKNSSWNCAEDHIILTIGKNSHLVGLLEASTNAYLYLLNSDDRQSAMHQSNYFQDFLTCFKEYIDSTRSVSGAKNSLPVLCLPKINSQAVVVTYGALQRDNIFDTPNVESSLWVELEKAATVFITGKSVPITWKPSIQMLSESTVNNIKPRTARLEPVTVKLRFENPLKLHLYLENIHLLWSLKHQGTDNNSEDEVIENETDVLEGSKYIKTEVIKELNFEMNEMKTVSLSLVPCVEGDVSLIGVAYSVCSTHSADYTTATRSRKIVRVKQNLKVRGPKLNSTLNDRVGCLRGSDYRLQFTAISQQPLLEIQFSALPAELLCGEVQTAGVTFHNRGQIPITSIVVSSKDAKHFAFGSPEVHNEASPKTFQNCTHFSPNSLSGVFSLQLPGGVLQPGQGATMAFWLRGMNTAGRFSISILFQYTNTTSDQSMSHRIVRKSFDLDVKDSLSIRSIKNLNFDKSFQMIFSMQNLLQSGPSNDQFKSALGLNALICVSKKWILRSLPQELDSFGNGDAITNLNSIDNSQITEQEQFNFAVTFDRIKDEGNYMVSIIPLHNPNEQRLHPLTEFLTRNSTLFENEQKLSSNSAAIGSAFSSPNRFMSSSSKWSDTEVSPLASSVLLPPKACLTLAFVWKISFYSADKSVLAFGQHFYTVSETDFDTSVSPIPDVALIQNPNLPYIIRYEVKYDVSKTYRILESFVSVLIKASFHNCSEKAVEVKLFLPESPTSSSAFTLDKLGVRESFAFWWVGQSTWVFTLPPLGAKDVSLKACFFKPGNYNLNNFSVVASFNSAVYKFVEQDCRFATFITIEPQPPNSDSSPA